jgi:hypothetical protein
MPVSAILSQRPPKRKMMMVITANGQHYIIMIIPDHTYIAIAI